MATKVNYHEYMASRGWGLKKRAVRERSGGLCERGREAGHVAPHENTHHLSYERLGNERLEDLLGVCRPCHEYLSGVADIDPAAPRDWWREREKPLVVYVAGKISKNDWRHELFPQLGDVTDSDIDQLRGRSHNWLTLTRHNVGLSIQRDGLLYGGPYFLSCDHGCYHGETRHGAMGYSEHAPCAEGQGLTQLEVIDSCLEQIQQSDIVFCWLDSPSAYGTLVELGYAVALSKSTFLATPEKSEWQRDIWFARELAKTSVTAPNHLDAWLQFLKTLRSSVKV